MMHRIGVRTVLGFNICATIAKMMARNTAKVER